jgi:flagellar biosynthesis protein FlhF
MQMQQFREATIQQALQAARAALGPDALVLSTEQVVARGWRGWLGRREIQITAARPAVSRRVRESSDLARPDAGVPPATDGLLRRLRAAGLTAEVAERAVSQLPAHTHRLPSMVALRAALASQFETMESPDEELARIEVFVGPPGMGKTTTVAKLAAQHRARGGAPVRLVAADGQRAGALEQLRVYAGIVGSPMSTVRSADDLQAMLRGGRQTVLIDTAGRSPKDEGPAEWRRVLSRRRGVRTHLVLSADTSVTMAQRALETFADMQPDRLLLTKVDEAATVMPLLDLALRRGLRISHLGTGQLVPDDLTRATASRLASALLHEE